MSIVLNRNLVVAVVSVLLAMLTIQSGASIAKQLFPLIGPEGTTALRLGFSALVLWLVFRPWRSLPTNRRDWNAIVTYGLCLGGMNILFYLAIARIPLGIGVALEFTGPLAVALFLSRRKRDLIWVACAVAGILCCPCYPLEVEIFLLLLLPVETKSHGTYVPSCSRACSHTGKNVTWKDALFPCRQPSSSCSPRTAK